MTAISAKWGPEATDLLYDEKDKQAWEDFLMSDEEFAQKVGVALGFHSMPEGLAAIAIRFRNEGCNPEEAVIRLKKHLAAKERN